MKDKRASTSDRRGIFIGATMDHYKVDRVGKIRCSIGGTIVTNQVAMLVKLRAQGLLKDVPACPLDQPDKEA